MDQGWTEWSRIGHHGLGCLFWVHAVCSGQSVPMLGASMVNVGNIKKPGTIDGQSGPRSDTTSRGDCSGSVLFVQSNITEYLW